MAAKGYEGIREKREGLWEGRFLKTFQDGTKKRVSVYGRTRDEVKDKLQREKQKKQRSANTTKLTVGEFLDSWLEESHGHIRHNTYLIRKNAIEKRLKSTQIDGKAFGDVPLANVTRAHVKQLFDVLARKEPDNGRARQVAFETLRAAMNVAVDHPDGLIDANPCTRGLKPKHKSAVPHRLTEDEIFRLLNAAERPTSKHTAGWIDSLRYFALFQLALAAGLREGELFALYKSDLNLRTGHLTINKTLTYRDGKYHRTDPKTPESRRTIYLDPVTKAALKAHLQRLATEGDQSPWLFPTVDRKPNHRDRFTRRQFKPLLKRAGLDHLDIPFHALRHAAATTMQSEGISPVTVQFILGHKVTATLGIYTGKTRKMDEEYARIMGEFFARRKRDGVQTGVQQRAKSSKQRRISEKLVA